MTIGEAVQLVIQAGAIGGDGDVLVLDMGEPVAIDAVAQQLIDLAGKPVDIVYTGLRRGEKLHEQLFGAGEVDERPRHPLISHVRVPPFAAVRRRPADVVRPPRRCDPPARGGQQRHGRGPGPATGPGRSRLAEASDVHVGPWRTACEAG